MRSGACHVGPVVLRWAALLVAMLGVACAATKGEVPVWERPGFYGAVRPEMGSPQPGEAAPDFELPTAAGGVFRLSSQRGSWVVLHFTATWCPICDAEVEHLGKLATDYAARRVRVVLVDVKEDPERWTAYAKEHVSPAIIALRDLAGDAAKRYAPPHAQPSFEDRAQVVLDATLILDDAGRIRLFLLPDSAHFDPTFQAVRAELDRVLPVAGAAPPLLAPEKVVSMEPRDAAITAPGARGEVVVPLRVAAGYHVMSDRPSAPEYIATRVHIDDAEGLAFGDAVYPPPASFQLAEHAIATFVDAFEVRVPFEVAAGAAPGERAVKGTLRYQSCTETRCLFPVTRAIELEVRIGSPPP